MMFTRLAVTVVIASAALAVAPAAHADRGTPPLLYGSYDVFVDFARQTFNGAPTPMESKTFPVAYTAQCDVSGCVVRMDNSDDLTRNPGAPPVFEYRWTNGRWETSGDYPYLCERMNPDSAVRAVRADYLSPNPDGSFSGQRTLTIEGAGCPGEGAGVHSVPISVTPADLPPAAPADRAEPVPLYGYYDAFLDHQRQTFNGRSIASPSATQLGLFSTSCDVNGCVARWLRETELAENPGAPALYEYRWNVDRWESDGEYPYHCDPAGGPTVPTTRSDFLIPSGDGSFSGERTFTVHGTGCPGEGPGSYWLPISLTPR